MKFTKNQTVLLEVKHLHGYAAEVIDEDEKTGVVTLCIKEESHAGFIVQFPPDVLVPLNHRKVKQQHKKNLENFRPDQEKPKHALEVHAANRLPWDCYDEDVSGLEIEEFVQEG